MRAASIATQVRDGCFIDPQPEMPEGSMGTPAPGGAFWQLNDLNPSDLADTLRDCGADIRGKLLAHVDEAAGRYNVPRLKAALRAASWQEHGAGVAGITLLDAIRNAEAHSAQTPGAAEDSAPVPLAQVWALLTGQSRPATIANLRVLPRDTLTTLQAGLGDAPVADRPLLTEVINDLLGTGTNMSADDVIDLQGLKGIARVMARIYNHRGQLIREQAAALGINTAAAAGIMKVESGGATFDEATNSAIARFENHALWSRWGSNATNKATFNAHFDFDRTKGGKKWTEHRWRKSLTDSWQACHQSQTQEWEILEFALGLAGDVAYECASFGAGQIMGFNYESVGYGSAKEMADEFNRSERSQVTGIFEFIRNHALAGAIQSGNYEAVARGYNGPGNVAAYGAQMRSAAESYATVTAGKTHVIL